MNNGQDEPDEFDRMMQFMGCIIDLFIMGEEQRFLICYLVKNEKQVITIPEATELLGVHYNTAARHLRGLGSYLEEFREEDKVDAIRCRAYGEPDKKLAIKFRTRPSIGPMRFALEKQGMLNGNGHK